MTAQSGHKHPKRGRQPKADPPQAERVAVLGTAQTPYKAYDDKNFPALIFEAAKGALDETGIGIKDVDAVVFGSSPEFFTGVNHPEMWCVEAAGGLGRPYMRIHTGGTVGISTAAAAFYHVAGGLFDTVLAVCGDKLNESPTQLGLSAVAYPLYNRKFSAGAVGGAGLGFREVMHRTGITLEDAAYVAVKQRQNAMKNPYAHLRIPNITMEMVRDSKVISEPLRLLDSCPVSDGAAAMLFVSEDRAAELASGGHCPRPAWVRAVAAASEGSNFPERDHVVSPLALTEAIRKAYAQAGITDPAGEIDVAEMYDPFSFQEILFAEALGFCPAGQGAQYVRGGNTQITGRTPINPSGGTLSANTIGCSAMARAVEAVLQVQGRAGERQVPDVRTALAHGWGGAFQFHVVMIFSQEV